MLRNARSASLFIGVEVGSQRVQVDLLQYADDTLFFCSPTYHNVLVIKAMLRSFELVSGLRVNFHKSTVGVAGISELDLRVFSKCLNSRLMGLPFKYLGMPIGGNPRKCVFWNPVVDKIRSRLSSWKGRLLSMAGRICLIKSVIIALPLFYFSFFKAPVSVCNQIRRIQAQFLWGWGHDSRKIAWVKWKSICRPIDYGGLGIKDISCFKAGLLAKWKWRLGTSKEGLQARYGCWRDMGVSSSSSKDSVWWKDLFRVCGNVTEGNWFDRRLQWCVGDGHCVKFWSDRWVDDKALKDKFPRLYSISLNKNSLVGDVAVWVGSRTSQCSTWNLSWRRERFEWEKHLEVQLMTLISYVKWDVRSMDRLVWVGEATQVYSVRAGYSILNGESFMQSIVSFKMLWSLSVAPSAIVSTWRILLDRLPTRLNLARRGVQLVNLLCPLCLDGDESTDHLFNTCRVVQQVWDQCDRWIRKVGVRH